MKSYEHRIRKLESKKPDVDWSKLVILNWRTPRPERERLIAEHEAKGLIVQRTYFGTWLVPAPIGTKLK